MCAFRLRLRLRDPVFSGREMKKMTKKKEVEEEEACNANETSS